MNKKSQYIAETPSQWNENWSNDYVWCVAIFGVAFQKWSWIIFIWYWIYFSKMTYIFFMPMTAFLLIYLAKYGDVFNTDLSMAMFIVCSLVFIHDTVMLFKRFYVKGNHSTENLPSREVFYKFYIVVFYIVMTNILWSVIGYAVCESCRPAIDARYMLSYFF